MASQSAPTHFNPCPSRACLVNQVDREAAAEKSFLDERLATGEANEKMVLEPLTYSSTRAGKKSEQPTLAYKIHPSPNIIFI
jgi:hypothetical protein